MTDTLGSNTSFVAPIVVYLGHDVPDRPAVITTTIPQGPAANGGELYSFPENHDDALFADHPSTTHIAEALSGVPETSRATIRRALIDGQFAHPSGVRGLPHHEAAQALIHPNGVWSTVAGFGRSPSFVHCPSHLGFEKFISEYYGCPVGMPADVEDNYWTAHGGGIYAPGAIPDPFAGYQMGHTTYGVLNQAMLQGGYTPYTSTAGTVGTATAVGSAPPYTLTGSSESGPTHLANDVAGQWLIVGPNASGVGSRVFGQILTNTPGTTPLYTVDRWYNAASPGGPAGMAPDALSFYQVEAGGPPATFVAISSDTTPFSYGGASGTADAALISTLMTGEFTTASSGLLRKVGVITFSAGTWAWINTVVFTATSTDQGLGDQTVSKAALTPSVVVNGGVLTYMTSISPSAVLSATGDTLTVTWTFTETHS